MDLTFSSEQLMVKESVERFVAERSPGTDHWSTFGTLGWLGIGTPEEVGGFGGPVERMIVMELFGRGLVSEPYATGAVLAGTILAAAHRHDLLAQLVQGETRFAVAYEEPEGGYDPAAIRTAAEKTATGYRLHGEKIRVITAPGPATFLVSTRSGDRLGLFAVAPDAAGLHRRDHPTEDGRNAATLAFDDVQLDANARVGELDAGLEYLESGLDHAVGALCAEAVGVMSVLHETTLQYLKERRQFGVAIGSFQALQHRMAEMFVELELARSMAYVAAMVLEGEAEPAPRKHAISAAKVQIANSGRFIGQNAIQLHGAIAMADEYKIGHYFKRMTTLERLFGDADYHLTRYASLSAGAGGSHTPASQAARRSTLASI